MRLQDSPFRLLGVSPFTSREGVRAAAEEKVLELGQEACTAARLALTLPKRRLVAEVAWLPGVAADDVERVMACLAADPDELLSLVAEWPALARTNAIAELIATGGVSSKAMAAVFTNLLDAFDSIETASLASAIVDARTAAGLTTPITDDELKRAVHERGREIGCIVAPVVLAGDVVSVSKLLTGVQNGRWLTVLMADDATEVNDILDRVLQDYATLPQVRERLERHKQGLSDVVAEMDFACQQGYPQAARATLVGLQREVVGLTEVVRPLAMADAARGLVNGIVEDALAAPRNRLVRFANEHDWYQLSAEGTEILAPLCALAPSLAESNQADTAALQRLIATQTASVVPTSQRDGASGATASGTAGVVIGQCQGCNRRAPVAHVSYLQNTGMLIARQTHTLEADLCRTCSTAAFGRMTLHTAFLGWWGTISVLVTPFYILNNLFYVIRTLGLADVDAGTGRELVTTSTRIGRGAPWLLGAGGLVLLASLCGRGDHVRATAQATAVPPPIAAPSTPPTEPAPPAVEAVAGNVTYRLSDRVAVDLVAQIDSMKAKADAAFAELVAADEALTASMKSFSAETDADALEFTAIEASGAAIDANAKDVERAFAAVRKAGGSSRKRQLLPGAKRLAAEHDKAVAAHNAGVRERNAKLQARRARYRSIVSAIEQRNGLAVRYNGFVDDYNALWQKLLARGTASSAEARTPVPHVELLDVPTPASAD